MRHPVRRKAAGSGKQRQRRREGCCYRQQQNLQRPAPPVVNPSRPNRVLAVGNGMSQQDHMERWQGSGSSALCIAGAMACCRVRYGRREPRIQTHPETHRSKRRSVRRGARTNRRQAGRRRRGAGSPTHGRPIGRRGWQNRQCKVCYGRQQALRYNQVAPVKVYNLQAGQAAAASRTSAW